MIGAKVSFVFNDTGGICPEDVKKKAIYADCYPRANGRRGFCHVFLTGKHTPQAHAAPSKEDQEHETALDQETFARIQASHSTFRDTCICQFIVLQDDDYGGHWVIEPCED
jgi:hypothetical protein